MQKQQFNDGSPITPEWLNAIQNPTFEGSSEDVGHLPLPPNYSEKQQCKTIHVYGASTSVDLDNWPYNAVILVHKAMNGETPVYPRELIVRCTNTTGAIIVIPELDADGTITVKATGTSIEDSYVTQSAVDGDIVVINANDLGSSVEIKTRKIRAGKDADYRRIFAQIFSIGTSENKITAQFDRNGNLVVSVDQGSNANSIVYQMHLKATSFSCGTENSNSAGFISFSEGSGNAFFKANSAGDTKSIEYSTETNVLSFTDQRTNQNNQTLRKTYYGAGTTQFEAHDNSNKRDVILIGKNVDSSLNVYDEPGCFTILYVPADSASQIYGVRPKKTCLRASGFSTYELQNGNWVEPNN